MIVFKRTTMSRIWILIGAGLFPMIAQAVPTKEYYYRPDEIYPVATGVGIATQIEIDPKEEVKDFGTGFSNGWDIVRRENVFYLKPKDLHSDTNMYVRTNRRTYLFDLKIVSKNWKNLEAAKAAGVNYRITFTYPVEAVAGPSTGTPESRVPAVTPPSVGEVDTRITGYGKYNINYDYSTDDASRWLVPSKVYDDGNFTYIYMPELTSSPSVYARTENSQKTEMLVNTTIENNVIVVHGTYPYLVLRYGDNVVGLRRNKS